MLFLILLFLIVSLLRYFSLFFSFLISFLPFSFLFPPYFLPLSLFYSLLISLPSFFFSIPSPYHPPSLPLPSLPCYPFPLSPFCSFYFYFPFFHPSYSSFLIQLCVLFSSPIPFPISFSSLPPNVTSPSHKSTLSFILLHPFPPAITISFPPFLLIYYPSPHCILFLPLPSSPSPFPFLFSFPIPHSPFLFSFPFQTIFLFHVWQKRTKATSREKKT